jgi:hypothetical protein
MKWTSGIAGAGWYLGPPVPLCALTGTPSSSHVRQIGSWSGW